MVQRALAVLHGEAAVRPGSQPRGDRTMTEHKFNLGQRVKLIPSAYIRNAHGEFEILRVLPEEHGMYQYRIKSITDGVVRVVMESEIA
jgi:hypothetical protein